MWNWQFESLQHYSHWNEWDDLVVGTKRKEKRPSFRGLADMEQPGKWASEEVIWKLGGEIKKDKWGWPCLSWELFHCEKYKSFLDYKATFLRLCISDEEVWGSGQWTEFRRWLPHRSLHDCGQHYALFW